MRNTKSAFTLVELIVVITILAILGTIAFISLQGYSAEARNSKRIQDLSSISSSLNIKLTRGMSVLSAISGSANSLSGISLAGGTGTYINSDNYNAGDVNYTALEMKAEEFQDPVNDDEYVLGATTLAGGPFQLAASVEEDGGEVAKVSGSYNARATSDTATGTGSSSSAITINLTDTGKFKVGDKTTQGTVTKISSDGTTITFNTSSIAYGTGYIIALSTNESDGLIGAVGALSTAVTDGGDDLPY